MSDLAEQVAALDREVGGLKADRSILEASVAALEAENGQLRRDLFAYQTMNANQAKIVERAMREEREWRQLYDEAKASQAAAESRLASARVEGAREFVARYVSANTLPDMTDRFFHYLRDLERFRDREYPAPAAPAGEQEGVWGCAKCGRGGPGGLPNCSEQACQAITTLRPAPTPEPEYVVVEVKVETDTGATIAGGQLVHESRSRITLTTDDCRRIVALGSRPTQTAEG